MSSLWCLSLLGIGEDFIFLISLCLRQRCQFDVVSNVTKSSIRSAALLSSSHAPSGGASMLRKKIEKPSIMITELCHSSIIHAGPSKISRVLGTISSSISAAIAFAFALSVRTTLRPYLSASALPKLLTLRARKVHRVILFRAARCSRLLSSMRSLRASSPGFARYSTSSVVTTATPAEARMLAHRTECMSQPIKLSLEAVSAVVRFHQ